MKDVFEWADVSLSSAFLTNVRLSGSKTQKDVVTELAAAAGVYLQWDSSKKPKLSGTWTNILKAQVIFARYITEPTFHGLDLNKCTSQDSSALTVNCSQRKEDEAVSQQHDLQNLQVSSTLERKNIVKENHSERNEVYVNITVSSSSFADILTQKKNVNLRENSKTNQVNVASRAQSPEANVTPEENAVSDVRKHITKLHCAYNGKDKVENILHFVVREESHTSYSAVKLKADVPSAESNAPVLCGQGSTDTDPSPSKDNHKKAHTDEGTVLLQSSGNTSDRETNVEKCGLIVVNDFKLQNKSQVSHSQIIKKFPKTSSDSHDSLNISSDGEGNTQFSLPKKGSVADVLVCFPVETKGSKKCNFQGDTNKKDLPRGKEDSGDTNKKVRRKNYEELAPFKFFCSQCSFKSKRESHYQRHMQLHEQVSNIYECEKCSFKTIRLGNLRRHELTHSDSELSCDLCTYRTLHHKLLIRHQRNKHINKLQDSEEKEIMQCSQCNYSTTRPYLLERHSKVHSSDFTNQLVFECSECPYKASRKEHLDRHTSNVHGCHRPFLCHHCGKAFKRPDALKQHSAVHLNHPPFRCPTCDKGCRSRAHLKQHLSVHSARRLFLCELCGASFKTRAVQRKHILTIHHHPKAYSCLNCSRRFNTKYALRRHMKQHLERKHKPGGSALEINAPSTHKHDETDPSVHLIQHESTATEKSSVKQTFGNTAVIINNHATGQIEGEKVAVQLRNHGSEGVQIIPAHAFIQQTNETATALLYLTGSFSSY